MNARGWLERHAYTVSIDVEANGLGGPIFCVGAILTELATGAELDRAAWRCPVNEPWTPWVAANVVPALVDVPVTHGSYEDMLVSVRRALVGWPTSVTIGHVVWPLEARLLSDVYPGAPANAPYPLLDVAGMLLAKGHDPTTVDGYLASQGIKPLPGNPHHPLYDARATQRAFSALMGLPIPWGNPGPRL